jgi:hypothetical protein
MTSSSIVFPLDTWLRCSMHFSSYTWSQQFPSIILRYFIIYGAEKELGNSSTLSFQGYCPTCARRSIGTLLSSTQILYTFKAACLCSFAVALLIPFRRILANSQNNPAAYTIFHLFTIDPTHFGLNGHHQGSQQSRQEPSRSLYVKTWKQTKDERYYYQ